MASYIDDELQPTERAASIAWRLARGERLTVATVANDYGMTKNGARYLLKRMCAALPIEQQGKVYVRLAGNVTVAVTGS